MACDRLVFEYLLCLDRKGLSDCQRDRSLIYLDRLRVAVFAAGGGGMYHLGLGDPYFLAIYQLICLDVVLVIGAASVCFVHFSTFVVLVLVGTRSRNLL